MAIEEEVQKEILKQKARVAELIQTCPFYLMSGKFDACNELCPVYAFCWDLQDADEKISKDLQESLGEITNGNSKSS